LASIHGFGLREVVFKEIFSRVLDFLPEIRFRASRGEEEKASCAVVRLKPPGLTPFWRLCRSLGF